VSKPYTIPRVSTSAGPSLAVYCGNLWAVFKAGDSSNRIYVTSSTDATNWRQSFFLPNQLTSAKPAAVEFNNKLLSVYKANDSSNALYMTYVNFAVPVKPVKPTAKPSVPVKVLKHNTKSEVPVKAMKTWENKDVVKWLGAVKLGSKRSQFVMTFKSEETTGEDLLAIAADGQKSFITEMKETFGIAPMYGRRMFKSLNALISQPNVESKSATSTTSRFTSDVDPSETPYQAPIYGVMSQPHMSIETACKKLKGVVAQVDKIAGCAKIAASHKIKGKDKHKLTVNERAAINMYTQESPLYGCLNEALRAKDRSKVKPFFPFLKLLLTGLGKIPKENGDFWRGVKRDLHADFEQKMKKKELHYFWSFKSTTLKADVLQNPMFLGTKGARTLFMIHGFSGVRIDKYSSIQAEAEVLFLPGSCFKIKNILKAAADLWIIELTEIKQEFPLIS